MSISTHDIDQMLSDFNSRGEKPRGRILALSRYAIVGNAQHFNDIFTKHGWNNRLDYDGLRLSDEQLFSALGFEVFEAMDCSDYEGADLVYDFNDPDVPVRYNEKYDYILDAGTLEHIFNLPNALKAVFQMLKSGGTFFFNQPVFIGHNHGLYGLSPCLFHEYFRVNRWRINSFRLFFSKTSNGPYNYINMSEQSIRSGEINEGPYCVMWGSATKTTKTTHTAVPQQPFYEELWQKCKDRNQKINETFETITDGMIYLYGTGRHAQDLIMSLSSEKRRKLEAGGLISTSPDEIGRCFMYGIRIYDISTVKPGDAIIIASDIYQNTIYDRIMHLENKNIKIIKLYC